MPRFAVLLRGDNVGKGNRLPMAEFRATLESLGYTGVRTLLNSGNAVFVAPGRSSAAHARAVRAALKERCGLELSVIVKSADELDAIAAENVLAAVSVDPARLLVAFTQDAAALRELADLAAGVEPPERFVVGEHAAFLLCPDGILKSRAGSALLGKRGEADGAICGVATPRRWTRIARGVAPCIWPHGARNATVQTSTTGS